MPTSHWMCKHTCTFIAQNLQRYRTTYKVEIIETLSLTLSSFIYFKGKSVIYVNMCHICNIIIYPLFNVNDAPKVISSTGQWLTNEISSLVFQFVSVKDSLVKCWISYAWQYASIRLECRFLRWTEVGSSNNLCWYNDSPQTVKVYGVTEKCNHEEKQLNHVSSYSIWL